MALIMTGDIRIHNGKIAQIERVITPTEIDKIVDANGLTLLPGVIDPQVHFREPGLEHKEDLFTASCACAKGGVTSFLEMPNTRPLTTTQAALNDRLQRSADHCLVNYGFFVGATAENLPDLIEAEPTCGIKIFMGSSHGALLVSQEKEKFLLKFGEKLYLFFQTKVYIVPNPHPKNPFPFLRLKSFCPLPPALLIF